MHGDSGSMIYKYDLPVLNLPIKFNNQVAVVDDKDNA
jgi:hypothetical protein